MAGIFFEDDSLEPEDLGLDTSPEAPATAQVHNSGAASVVEGLFKAEEPVPEAEAAEAGDADLDVQMDAVEKRLATAQFYRLVLDNSLFAGDTSAPAQQVDREVRAFVRERMKILMGVQPEKVAVVKPAEETFTPTEVAILKQIVSLAAKRTQPALNQVPAPHAQEPEAAKPVPALKPVQTPASKPVAAKPALKPVQTQASKPVAAKPQAKAGAMDPATDPRLPNDYRKDPTLVMKNNRWWVQAKNADEEPLWTLNPQTKKAEPLLKDVTLAARPQGVQIMQQPIMRSGDQGGEQFNMLMRQQADVMVGLKEKQLRGKNAAGLFGATLAGNIVPGGGDVSSEGGDY